MTEAQLRGIPVIASNAGGLAEAKIGLPFCIPVELVTGARHPNGDYVVPKQNLDPWVEAVEALVDNTDQYNIIARLTASESAKWLTGLDERAIEKWLIGMLGEEKGPAVEGETRMEN